VGKRLIIQHGQRVTRHELDDRAIVIGRDPSCDLFFSDQKLSRRHARIELGADGVKLTDLGSRNGSWVNEQRVEERLLQVDDKVRVGRLQITIEEDPQPETSSEPGGDVTVVVSGSPPVEEMGNTVRLDSAPRGLDRTGEAEQPDDTVLFSEISKQDRDQTVVLPGASASGDEGGTVVFHPPSEESADTMTHDPAPAPTQPSIEREESAGSYEEELEPTAVEAPVDRAAAFSSVQEVPKGSLRPLAVTVLLSLVAYLVVAVPLVLSTGRSLRNETLARGRALVDLLAAHNMTALAAGEEQALSVESVSNRPGVEDALVLNREGRVMAPAGRSGEALEIIEGTTKKVSEIGEYFQERTSAGDYALVTPLTHEGERIGFAVLRYSGAEAAEGRTVPGLLLLGFLLILGGACAAYFLTRKKTVVATETTLSEHSEPTLTDF
jgi:pSer/pThr/pTyr-binding forkhead associated (FHA) protein